jgi:hypothetical protein
MGQQPNIEMSLADLPREEPEPEAARRWRPTRPGVIVSPKEMRWGGSFGTPGPDTGWAIRLVRAAHLPDRTPDLEALLVTLMSARASQLGRAPMSADLEVAKLMCGIGEGLPAYLSERRQRWLRVAAHEKVKGRSAVAELDPDLLTNTPGRIRYVLTR